MAWQDFYKLFKYSFESGPKEKLALSRNLSGAGVTQPDVGPVRQDGSFWSGGDRGLLRLRDTNDFIDLSTVTNRQSRYKEYERLRNVSEIEMVMTVFADEACLTWDTKISTLFYGPQTIRWLVENKKDEEFLVYCWDFDKNDYSLGWAYAPRFVKVAPTVKILLDNGEEFKSTYDHRVLLRDRTWKEAGKLKVGDELMPFYKVPAKHTPEKSKKNKLRVNQFPRIFTFQHGWVNERQFINYWKWGKQHHVINIKEKERQDIVHRATKMLSSGLLVKDIVKIMNHNWASIHSWIESEGYSSKEIKNLGKTPDRRRVVGVFEGKEEPVYDLSVKEHQNFCGENVVFHNCQRNENNHVVSIECENKSVKDELEFLFYNRNMLNIDRKLWNWSKKLYIYGDIFLEVIINPENPKEGVLKLQELPVDSMYRIETTKGKLVEFQQSAEGPDYESLARAPVTHATDAELMQSKALRFDPNQIIHIRIGDDRRTFYPYGQSLIEPARGPAHQLRLMEDAMLVYRLSRSTERRIFYIDVGQLPPFRAEAFIERMKDMLRKKKVHSNSGQGASGVEERYHTPALDEDFWLPVRPNSNTRIETLPGAANLGEISDTTYFKDKLYIALNFPKNYFSSEDPNATRITLSAQDVKFARMVERLQSYMEDGLWEAASRHLRLRGFPEELYEDLKIKCTPPSDWRELSRAEVVTNRINNANSLKGAMLLSDYDILSKWMKYNEDEVKEMLARTKLQKLEELKLQVLAQNPQLLGVGVPGQDETEIGAEANGPNPMLGSEPPQQMSPEQGGMPSEEAPSGEFNKTQMQGIPLPEPDESDINKYDLNIEDYESEQDFEDTDYSEI